MRTPEKINKIRAYLISLNKHHLAYLVDQHADNFSIGTIDMICQTIDTYNYDPDNNAIVFDIIQDEINSLAKLGLEVSNKLTTADAVAWLAEVPHPAREEYITAFELYIRKGRLNIHPEFFDENGEFYIWLLDTYKVQIREWKESSSE